MSTPLILAITMITSALIFYTWGVWSEHRAGQLKMKHLVLFLIGLVFDTTGTFVMSSIAKANEGATLATTVATTAGLNLNWHAITGGLAIALMAFHALWAIVVLVRKDAKAQSSFHKFSLIVWTLWLIPYVSGAFIAMR